MLKVGSIANFQPVSCKLSTKTYTMEINNYYEIQDVYNKTHICKLISIDNTKNIFKDLGNNQEFEIDNKIIFREASINNHHLKELHFKKKINM